MKLSLSDILPDIRPPANKDVTVKWIAPPDEVIEPDHLLLVVSVGETEHQILTTKPLAIQAAFARPSDIISYKQNLLQIDENLPYGEPLLYESNDVGSVLRHQVKHSVELIQSRIDAILDGTAEVPESRVRRSSDDRLFAPFSVHDKQRASALASAWMKMVQIDKSSVIRGMNRAVDHMYESLGKYPTGMVEHAVKVFLTHHEPARKMLTISPLSVRQPGLVANFD